MEGIADEALYAQIGTTLTPSGGIGTTAELHTITISVGTFTKDGVYVTVKNTNVSGGLEGFVFVETVSY